MPLPVVALVLGCAAAYVGLLAVLRVSALVPGLVGILLGSTGVVAAIAMLWFFSAYDGGWD